MLNLVIVRKTRREESRQKNDGIKMEKSCPRTVHYGYKLHTIMDTTHDLIRRIETTTANVHDSQVDQKKGKWSISGISGSKMQGI